MYLCYGGMGSRRSRGVVGGLLGHSRQHRGCSDRRRGCFGCRCGALGWLVTYDVGSYRKARAYVSYVTWARAFRYEPAMVVSTVAAARSAPGLMALSSVGWCCASVGWCCASVASPAAGSTTREPRLLSVAALRVIVAFAVCDYLLSSIRFSPVMSAGCSSPMMWRIEGATSARRPFLTVALLLSVT